MDPILSRYGASGKPGAIQDGSQVAFGIPFPGSTRGITATSGDINGDGIDDLIFGDGRGGGEVKILDGVTLREIDRFYPYGKGNQCGVLVAGARWYTSRGERTAICWQSPLYRRSGRFVRSTEPTANSSRPIAVDVTRGDDYTARHTRADVAQPLAGSAIKNADALALGVVRACDPPAAFWPAPVNGIRSTQSSQEEEEDGYRWPGNTGAVLAGCRPVVSLRART